MASSSAATVEGYLAELTPDRRAALEAVRGVIRQNLAPGFEEGMLFGMIGYYVPLERFPVTYNGQPLCLAGLAAQKHHLAVYLMSVYGHRETRRWFEQAYRASGKKLNMGKSCVRFRSLDDLPLDLVGEVIKRVSVDGYIDHYQKNRGATGSGRRAPRRTSSRAAGAAGKKTIRTTRRASGRAVVKATARVAGRAGKKRAGQRSSAR
jgi:hypothetical protein